MEVNEVKITRILNPTSINLGEYVINPYKGCPYACLYCYVRFNKVTMRETRPWGEYVDVRVNSPELLEKELLKKNPKRVLLGSTTECFGPYEERYGVTGKILDILNKNGIYYSILTRSPFIIKYLSQLKSGYCENIYFTINNLDDCMKRALEPKSPAFELRNAAINKLIDNDVHVIPYFSPVLPHISKFENIFGVFPKAKSVEFEGLNFNLGNIDKVIDIISNIYLDTGRLYDKMRHNEKVYEEEWSRVKTSIVKEAVKYKKNHDIYIHKLWSFFENRYVVNSAQR